jgi:gliding motility-associated-like protein
MHPIPDGEIFASNPNGCNPLETDFSLQLNNTVDPNTSTYSWDLGNGDQSTLSNPFTTYTIDGATQVNLILTSVHGCDTTLSTTVEVYPLPIAAFVPDPDNFTTAALPRFRFNNTSTVSSILGSIIQKSYWEFGDPINPDDTSTERSPTYFYQSDTGTYRVYLLVETNFGCQDTFSYSVVIGPDLIVYVPNAFTPTKDAGPQENDEFKAFISGEKSMELIIFNRWGEVVFRTTDKNLEWDGTYKGEPVQQDVYAYQLVVVALNDKVYNFTGTITVIR